MVLKGGILLAIRYQSHRYTTDIDFSTDHILDGQVTEALIRESLGGSLTYMVESLDYDLDCRIQSSKVQPNDPNATYPSIKLKIGYAYKGSAKHKRLLRLESPTSVSIDYSLNESIPNIDNVKIGNDQGLQVYSLTDIIAEKYRSLLQQSTRNRHRRQDVYDLNLLINKIDDVDDVEKENILDSLIKKSNARGISPTRHSFSDPELKRRANKDYATLQDEIAEKLPDFDRLFETVSQFYQSLPW